MCVLSRGGLWRVHDTLFATRDLGGILKASADGAAYSAPQLVAVERAAEKAGTAFADAGKAVKACVDAGVATDRRSRGCRPAI